MFVFNNRTSTALSLAVLILGASIGYSIYKSGSSNSRLIALERAGKLGSNSNESGGFEQFLSTTTINFVPDTLTSLVGQEAFSTFVKTKTQGGTIGNDTVDAVSNAFSNALENVPFVDFRETTVSDLNLIQSAKSQDFQNFSNKLKSVLDKYRSQFYSLTETSPTQDETEESFIFNQLYRSSSIYKGLASELLYIPAPNSAGEGLKDLINSYELSASGLAEVKNYTKDPIRAGAGIKIHEQAAILEIIAIQELKDAFKASGIIFSMTPLSS